MDDLIQIGKRNTLLVSISILLVSLHSIYFYHAAMPEIETQKLLQQTARLLFTIGLLVAIYKGKRWARTVSLVLFALATIGAIVTILFINGPFMNKVPLVAMTFVYSVAIYHWGFSRSFKAFFESRNLKA